LRLPPRSSVTIAAVVSALVVVATIGVVLLHRAPRLAATNTRVSASLVGVVISANRRRCQGGEYVPASASRMRVFVGFAGAATGPRLHLDYFTPQRVRAFSAVLPAGYGPGPQMVRLPAHATLGLGLLCIGNDGPIPVGLAGNLTSLNPAARTGSLNGPGERPGDDVRTDYFLSGQPRWLDMSSTIVSRAALFRPTLESPGSLWAMLAVFVIVVAVACAFAVGRLGEQPGSSSAPAEPQRARDEPGP